jgi:DNA invertase Pin-like site-specific DNA recombinase
LYARVSTDAQQKEGTIESQVLELKRQIAAVGDVLVKEYVDDGYSGTLLDRPGLEELRRDVKTDLSGAQSGQSIAWELARIAGKIGARDEERQRLIDRYAAEQMTGEAYITANRAPGQGP